MLLRSPSISCDWIDCKPSCCPPMPLLLAPVSIRRLGSLLTFSCPAGLPLALSTLSSPHVSLPQQKAMPFGARLPPSSAPPPGPYFPPCLVVIRGHGPTGPGPASIAIGPLRASLSPLSSLLLSDTLSSLRPHCCHCGSSTPFSNWVACLSFPHPPSSSPLPSHFLFLSPGSSLCLSLICLFLCDCLFLCVYPPAYLSLSPFLGFLPRLPISLFFLFLPIKNSLLDSLPHHQGPLEGPSAARAGEFTDRHSQR